MYQENKTKTIQIKTSLVLSLSRSLFFAFWINRYIQYRRPKNIVRHWVEGRSRGKLFLQVQEGHLQWSECILDHILKSHSLLVIHLYLYDYYPWIKGKRKGRQDTHKHIHMTIAKTLTFFKMAFCRDSNFFNLKEKKNLKVISFA